MIFLNNKPTVVFYTHTTNKHSYKIYFNPKINKKIYKNIRCLVFKTVFHVRKFFYRFLKENNFFFTYLNYITKYKNSYQENIPSLEHILAYHYEYPFNHHIQTLITHLSIRYDEDMAEDVIKMRELAKQWLKLFKSIQENEIYVSK